MDEEIEIKVTKAELGLIHLAICELMDKKAGTELDRNDLVHNQLIDLRNKIITIAKSLE